MAATDVAPRFDRRLRERSAGVVGVAGFNWNEGQLPSACIRDLLDISIACEA